MTNIFVGNLDPGMTEDQLRKLFEPHGTVETVTVVTDRDTGQSRGFAFVEMASDSEAKTAIEALRGALWEGRRLDVNEARPKSERGDTVEQRKHTRDALDTRKHRQHRL
jgi:RNA recognition motif-containing protein